MDIKQAFGKNLRERRNQLGLTQAQLADALNYSTKAVSKWESGSGLPSAALLPTIARVLNTDIDSLMKVHTTPLYYLGVDGGGTKTEFCLAGGDGKIIATRILGGSNPNDIGISACCAVLKEGITAVCGDIPYERISVFAGIAGAGTGDNGQRIGKFLTSFGFASAACGSDAKNAIAASLGSRDGIVVIMGTGNVTFVQKAGEQSKIGGFSYFFDEGGSGFTIGRDAITYALKAEERENRDTLLYNLVREKCDTPRVLDRLGDFYVEGKQMVAWFAPLVFDAYRKGDAAAFDILDKNAAVVAQQIDQGIQRLGEDDPDVVIVGGLTKQKDILLPLIQKHLKRKCNMTAFPAGLAQGALRIAGLEENNA